MTFIFNISVHLIMYLLYNMREYYKKSDVIRVEKLFKDARIERDPNEVGRLRKKSPPIGLSREILPLPRRKYSAGKIRSKGKSLSGT